MKTNKTLLRSKSVQYRIYAMAVALVLVLNVRAQTIPAAQSLPYAEDFSTVDSNYPAGWQGWTINNNQPSLAGRPNAPTADRGIAKGSINSTGTGIYDFGEKIGFLSVATDIAVCLAINTTGAENIQVSFDAMTIRNPYNGSTNTQLYGLVLQYRVGNTIGAFTPLDYAPYYNTLQEEHLSGDTDQHVQTGLKVTLPTECENQEVVQLRWIHRRYSGNGDKPSIAIDNVRVEQLTGEEKNDDATLSSLSVSTDNGATFQPLTTFNALTGSYTYYLTKEQPLPMVNAQKNDEKANNPVIEQATTENNATASISVTAEDGETTKVYEIRFVETEYVFINGSPDATWGNNNIYFSEVWADGCNKYQGANYARCMSGATSAHLTLPATNSIGTLSFYARKIDARVEGNITVNIQIGEGDWTVVKDLGDLENLAYQEFRIDINKKSAEDIRIRFNITKNGDTFASAGYYLDDFAYTACPDIVLPPVSNLMTITAEEAALYETDALITVKQLTITGTCDAATLANLQIALGANDVITSIVFEGIAGEINVNYFANLSPNSLKYVPAGTTVAEAVTDITNLIIDGTTAKLELIDGYPFNCPANFTATNAIYTRECHTDGGWETIMLPFAVNAIKNNGANLAVTEYTIEKFTEVKGTEKVLFTSIEVEDWTADTPYIISFANGANDTETYTFEGSGEIAVTLPGTEDFKGTYTSMDGDGLYILNNTGTEFGEGEEGNSTIPEFRAYLAFSGSNAPLFVEHKEGGSTGMEVIESAQPQVISIYTIDGCLVYKGIPSSGTNILKGLAKGIYVVNNQKVVIK